MTWWHLKSFAAALRRFREKSDERRAGRRRRLRAIIAPNSHRAYAGADENAERGADTAENNKMGVSHPRPAQTPEKKI
jgi:hypothetical protein